MTKTDSELSSKISFKALVRSLFEVSDRVDTHLVTLQKDAVEIQNYYVPRAEFIRWRDSVEGQAWKKQQYEYQYQCCAICQKYIQLKGSHIDHIKPIYRFPELNVDKSNLQITCSTCNLSKGATL